MVFDKKDVEKSCNRLLNKIANMSYCRYLKITLFCFTICMIRSGASDLILLKSLLVQNIHMIFAG